MIDQEKLQLFKEKIDSAKKIAIFSHENVDGDAIGSMLGLGRLLEKLGKDMRYFTTITPAKSFAFVKNIDLIKTDFDYGNYDLIIFVDMTPYRRINGITFGHEDYFNEKYKIIIDHHIDEKQRGNLEIKDVDSTSNCGWLYENCMQIWPELIDADIATYRYMGLITDSGNFMYGNQGARDFKVAQGLLEHGADKNKLIQELFYSSPAGVLSISQNILQRARVYENVLYTYYTNEELGEYKIDDDDTEAAQILLKSIKGNPVYLRLRYTGAYWSGSLRSGYQADGSRVNVEKIAKSFGGGGHMFAAGFAALSDTTLSFEEQIQSIVSKVNEEAMKQM